MTAYLFTPSRAFANLNLTFTGNIDRYFYSKATLLFTIFKDQISLQSTRIGLTHVSKDLHNSSTAFVKILDCLKIIPKYLYSIERIWSFQLPSRDIPRCPLNCTAAFNLYFSFELGNSFVGVERPHT